MGGLTKGERMRLAEDLRRGDKPQILAQRYGVSETTVYKIAKEEGVRLRRWKRWTKREDQLIREIYPYKGAAWSGWQDLMPDRKPSPDSIAHRAKALGVYHELTKRGREALRVQFLARRVDNATNYPKKENRAEKRP